ncbi:aminopeptidase N [Trabulsiella guamensis ATCC 49490]|uniref:Aminopeptidase N n=1 Tax=Trabulsiella guamensis ATCC 49490 TaxID=1005994 RepID=A0A085A5P4_9ENTR|nr:YcxB family protein [Trabulsiella guamensis]KFC05539.1 aminopeptidase N [Trabulsiella guamensis ATCC 49490]
MVTQARFTLDFSLSVLERAKAGKLIKEHEKKETIQPYDSVFYIRKAAISALIIAVAIIFIMLITLTVHQNVDVPFMERTRVFSILSLCLIGISAILFRTHDYIFNKITEKNNKKEQEDKNASVKLKINRYYIEYIQENVSIKTYWSYIGNIYRKGGFIFIQARNNRCLVIPERIFENKNDINKLYEYLKEQISRINEDIYNTDNDNTR